jgi:hypothetical protein
VGRIVYTLHAVFFTIAHEPSQLKWASNGCYYLGACRGRGVAISNRAVGSSRASDTSETGKTSEARLAVLPEVDLIPCRLHMWPYPSRKSHTLVPISQLYPKAGRTSWSP